jgi:predicted membrane channel-forming protein YqfA (hemolysin III family)
MEPSTASTLFLVSLAVFGIGYCFQTFRAGATDFLSGLVGIAAGVMGVLALVTLF